MSDRFLTSEEVAALLGLSSKAALEQMRRRGFGPPWIRVAAKLVRYRLSDLETWIEAQRCAPTAAEARKLSAAPGGAQ